MSSAIPHRPNRPASALPFYVHMAGAGDNIVLIHGGRGSHTHWIKNIGALSTCCRVYALDLPGFGKAPDVPRDIDADSYLFLIHQGVKKLIGDRPTAIVGFSFGGAVAADLGRRLGEQCRKLALISPGGFGQARGRQLDLRPAPAANPTDPHYRAVIRHNLLAMMLHEPKSIDDRTIDLQCDNIAHTRFNSLKVSLQPTLLSNLASMTCPLLMIWGEDDRVAFPSPAARAAECRKIRPNMGLAMIPAAGHWVQYEASEAVNRLLLNFLCG